MSRNAYVRMILFGLPMITISSLTINISRLPIIQIIEIIFSGLLIVIGLFGIRSKAKL